MTTIFNNPVALKAGTTTSQGIQVADGVNQIIVSVLRWNGNNSCSLSVEYSFDNGATWWGSQAIGAVVPSQLDAWKTKKPGFSGNLQLTIDMPRMCTCGESYLPGAPLNGLTTNHSTYKGWTSQQIGAIFPGQWLHDADPAAFHNPENQPATGLPLRQIRAITVASGNVNTTLKVDTVP